MQTNVVCSATTAGFFSTRSGLFHVLLVVWCMFFLQKQHFLVYLAFSDFSLLSIGIWNKFVLFEQIFAFNLQ